MTFEMDFVWNETLADQVRDASRRAMQGQVDDMHQTAANFNRQAEQRELEANQLQARLPFYRSESRSRTRTVNGRTETEHYTVQVPDPTATAEAMAQIEEMRQQAQEVRRAAVYLIRAANELAEAIRRTEKLFKRLYEESRHIDAYSAARMQAIRDDIEDYIRRMLEIKNSFGAGESIKAANLSTLSWTAEAILNSINDPSPCAAVSRTRLFETSKEILQSVSTMHPLYAGLRALTAMAGDPINTATGNFYYTKEDLTIPGRTPLTFKRFYNAIGSFDGILGRGWTHNYNIRLFHYDNLVHILFDDGHVEVYTHLENDIYIAPEEHKNTLRASSEEGFAFDLHLHNSTRYGFDHTGALRCIDDPSGNKTILEYNSDSTLLESVTTQSGSLHFSYNDDARLLNVSDHTGRSVSFEYENDQLITASSLTGGAFKYQYNEQNLLYKITNPMGVDTVWNRFDKEGRTITQHLADDGVARLEYNDGKMITVFEEQNGNKTEYHRDELYRTVKIAHSDETTQTYEYDQNGNCTMYKDRKGNRWRFEYDAFGNMTKSTDPLNNTTIIKYNSYNKPTEVTKPNGAVIKMAYDRHGNETGMTDPLGRITAILGDSQGKVLAITLPDGSKSIMEYDQRGNITKLTGPDGNTICYEYNALNRVIKTTNSEGAVTLFEYNAKGNITKVTDALGNTRTYEYNLSGKVTKIVDFNGSVIEYKYNRIGKIEEIIDPAGGITKLTYDIMWNVTSVTDPMGNTVYYQYDEFNRVVKTIDQEGNATTYFHDENGNVWTVTSPNGAKTGISNDGLNRQTEVRGPDGSTTRVTYDKVGNRTQLTDALGNTTTWEYDLANQQTKLTDPLGNETHFTYTVLGQIETMTNAKGHKYTYTYYLGGKLKSVTLPDGETEFYGYNKNGKIQTVTDTQGNQTTLKYDLLDRITKTTNALGHSKHFVYDAVNNITQITDENGNVTRFKYSLLNDIVEVIDAAGHSTKYNYNAVRQLMELRQYNSLGEPQVTTYERNKKGDITAVTSPLGDIVKYSYDAMGNVTSKVDEDEHETLYSYNLVNKLAKVSYADGKTVEFEYDALKQLTQMRDWLGTTSIEHNPMGKVSKVTDHEGNEVGYSYDAIGQKEKLIYPDGREVSYEHTASGKISKVLATTATGVDITSYAYNSLGLISERVLPDNTTTKYEFNPLRALASLTHSRGAEILDQFKYSHDPVGNITEIEKHRIGIEADNGVFKYAYDPVNRLTEATNGAGDTKHYGYDPLGNRIFSLQNGVETRHSFNARNQLLKTIENSSAINGSETNGTGSTITDYLYDKRGNLTQELKDGQLKASYVFDATNMMVGASAPAKGDATYTYNGFRNRVAKLESFHTAQAATANTLDPTKELRYILDMTLPYDNLLMTKGAHEQSFVWGNGLLSANIAGATSKDAANNTNITSNFYYLQDHLGSPIRLLGDGSSDSNNTAIMYDEFGVPEVTAGSEQTQQAQSLHNPFGFTGYQTDDISGLYYAQARFYNPTTGRFGAEDPIKDQLNWYGYCANNPVAFIDPSGLMSQTSRPSEGGSSGGSSTSTNPVPPFCVCNRNPCQCGGASQSCTCRMIPCRCLGASQLSNSQPTIPQSPRETLETQWNLFPPHDDSARPTWEELERLGVTSPPPTGIDSMRDFASNAASGAAGVASSVASGVSSLASGIASGTSAVLDYLLRSLRYSSQEGMRYMDSRYVSGMNTLYMVAGSISVDVQQGGGVGFSSDIGLARGGIGVYAYDNRNILGADGAREGRKYNVYFELGIGAGPLQLGERWGRISLDGREWQSIQEYIDYIGGVNIGLEDNADSILTLSKSWYLGVGGGIAIRLNFSELQRRSQNLPYSLRLDWCFDD